MFTMLDLIRVSLPFFMLAYAGYKDFRYREVSDIVWIVFGLLSIPLDIYEIWIGDLSLITLLIALFISVIFSFGGWYLGLFGEADLLAFIVFAALCPQSPITGYSFILFTPVIFSLSVISNSILLSCSSLLIVFLLNILGGNGIFRDGNKLSIPKRILLIFTARRKDIKRVTGPPFEYPLEFIGEDKETHIKYRPNFSDDASAIEALKNLREAGRIRIWVTYTLPFLFLLLIGYSVTIIFGDLTIWIISKFI